MRLTCYLCSFIIAKRQAARANRYFLAILQYILIAAAILQPAYATLTSHYFNPPSLSIYALCDVRQN